MRTDGTHPNRICSGCRQSIAATLDCCPHCGVASTLAPVPDSKYLVGQGQALDLPDAKYKHPQVVAAALTFCIGLLLFRVVLTLMGQIRFRVSTGSVDPLLALEILTIACTVVYLVLRQNEGDFRSLFLISMALFMGEECIAYCSSAFWVSAFQELGVLFTFASCIFGSLSLIAAVYDPPSQDPYRAPLVAACVAVLMVCSIRALGTLPIPPFDRYQHLMSIMVLVAVAVFLGAKLLKAPRARVKVIDPGVAKAAPGLAGYSGSPTWAAPPTSTRPAPSDGSISARPGIQGEASTNSDA